LARLVVVSNRVPVPKVRGASAGGLAVALKDIMIPGSVWFGWSGRISERTADAPTQVEGRGVNYVTIDLSAEDHRKFYLGFSNGTLWPLFHFRLGLVHFRREDYRAYVDVNQAYANALAGILEPDDLVWVHDFHLIPLARLLRKKGIKNRIGFFLHTPFVPPTVISALPVARDILLDMLHYDVTGFQTQEHAHDFVECTTRILGAQVAGEMIRFRGETTRILVCPIGIDAESLLREAKRAERSPENVRMRESLGEKALAIGVDRLDYSKGLPERFEGFSRLLARHPEHHRKISFLQIAPVSRQEVIEYKSLRLELDRLAGHLNGHYSQFDWVPLRYSTRATRREVLAGFYRIAKIGIVTPLRDGMNLVAKEYVAAQDEADPGVLVLSCLAGAAEELTEALLVNPYDPDEIADALHIALLMPRDERKARHTALREKVRRTTAAAYCDRFLMALRSPSEASAA